jgi:AraC-like DNA-binding protein
MNVEQQSVRGECLIREGFSVEYQRTGPTWRALEGRADALEWFVVTRGYLGFEAGNFRVNLRVGEGLVIPGRCRHARWASGGEPLEGLSVLVSERWLPNGAFGPSPITLRDDSGRLREIAGWLVPSDAEDVTALYRRTLFGLSLRELQRVATQEPGQLEQRTRAFIEEKLSERLSLEDLARNAGMSRCHFSRTYRKLTGVSPMESLRLVRLERAKEMILTTQSPLKAIAVEVGLGSEFQLSRLLKSRLGVGARDLRRKRFLPMSSSVASRGARPGDEADDDDPPLPHRSSDGRSMVQDLALATTT